MSCLLVFLILNSFTPLTAVNVSAICDDNANVTSLLQQLKSNVSGIPDEAFQNVKNFNSERKALYNKIKAISNQITAGAFRGSLKKLENDFEKRVKRRIVDPWRTRLLELIGQIKCLIENLPKCHPIVDSIPPSIREVLYYPSLPEYDDYVLVLAHVTDCWSGVANVTLSYSVDSGESVNLTMYKIDDLYRAEIPPQHYGLNVTFRVYAFDNAGNMAVSQTYSYVVGDSRPPVISYVERVPSVPNYNETVFVYVNATEPPLASGVEKVIVSYSNGTEWINESMRLQNGLYVAEIPAFPYGTLIEYVIYAFDNASNVAVTQIYSYSVDDRFLPVAIIDAPKYISESATLDIYIHDDNLLFGKLTVDGETLAYFNQSGSYAYMWNTTGISDGTFTLRLDVYDKADNHGWAECEVIIDKTAPKVEIELPKNGSYVNGLAIIQVNVEDLNLERAELTINNSSYVWTGTGTFTYVWETTRNDDGWYTILLRASDKAGNENQTSLEVFVDNTAPSLVNLTWSPLEPSAGENVSVTIQAFDYGSGVKNVTLWFRTDESKWQRLEMNLKDGNWTCLIPGQNESRIVIFYIECYDNAGNYARTIEEIYAVKAAQTQQQPFPLSWLLLIIIIIGAAVTLTTYIFRHRRKGTLGKTVALLSLK